MAIRIRAAVAADTAFMLSLAPRLLAFALPRAVGQRAALARIRATMEQAWRSTPRGGHWFIAETARGRRTGFLHLELQTDFLSGLAACHVSELVVCASDAGHGIGTALLDYAQAFARQHQCRMLTLGVFPGNARARALYVKAGFDIQLLRMAKALPRARARPTAAKRGPPAPR